MVSANFSCWAQLWACSRLTIHVHCLSRYTHYPPCTSASGHTSHTLCKRCDLCDYSASLSPLPVSHCNVYAVNTDNYAEKCIGICIILNLALNTDNYAENLYWDLYNPKPWHKTWIDIKLDGGRAWKALKCYCPVHNLVHITYSPTKSPTHSPVQRPCRFSTIPEWSTTPGDTSLANPRWNWEQR